MRRLRRAAARCPGFGSGWILVFLMCVHLLFWWSTLHMSLTCAVTHARHSVLLDLTLLALLAALYLAWFVWHGRRQASAASGMGLLLAGYGLACRQWCTYLVFGGPAEAEGLVYAGRSALETHPSGTLQFLIAAHRYGGLLAYGIGIALTVWMSARDARGPFGYRPGAGSSSDG